MGDIYRVGFTGMRAIKDMSDEQQNLIKEEIQTYLLALAKDANLINEDDIMQVYVGGAIGFDQLAFDAAYELKEYIDFTLELIIAIPFIGYNNNWINGYSYNGEHKRGVFNGFGILKSPNGSVYSGNFKNGLCRKDL